MRCTADAQRSGLGRDGHYRLLRPTFDFEGGALLPRRVGLAGSLGVHGATLFRLCLDPGASLARPAPLQPRFEMCCDLRLGAIHDSVCVCYFKDSRDPTSTPYGSPYRTLAPAPPPQPRRERSDQRVRGEAKRAQRAETSDARLPSTRDIALGGALGYRGWRLFPRRSHRRGPSGMPP